MSNIEELIETTRKLSKSLEQAASNERKFCVDIQLRLEAMSWEMWRSANELNELKYYLG